MEQITTTSNSPKTMFTKPHINTHCRPQIAVFEQYTAASEFIFSDVPILCKGHGGDEGRLVLRCLKVYGTPDAG
ncbi:hypothetical protein Pmani_040219 [Petrolisthes manimaculis]|uniref:Uncharacterized protein n=1 Tax=Petrolisthes manimaculis TaxID=1843537 RepID=A0AAE1NB35_9EUCA|nr:hypothetical protein Pmani_040219 [Petrolisthes manimaculis]